MEEASIAAVNGELSPFTTGVTACRMIGACRDMTDYRRASEWIEATERYCDRQSLSGFPGRLPDPPRRGRRGRRGLGAGRAGARAGDDRARRLQRRRRRRPTGSTRSATSAGCEATSRAPRQPCARRTLAVGRRSRRSRSSAWPRARSRQQRRRSTPRWPRRPGIAGPGPASCRPRSRSRSRPATSGRRERRSMSSAAIVKGYPSPALEAGRQVALGRVLAGRGRRGGGGRASCAPRSSGWREVGAPYEVARARAVLARALRALDDEDDARPRAARPRSTSSAASGRRIDVEAAERELRDVEDRRSGPATAHKTFMFTDIVGSTNLAEALGDQAWERLLRWHDDMLRSRDRERGRGDRQLDRRRVLRRLRRRPGAAIECAIDPAGAARPCAPSDGLRPVRSGSAAHAPRRTGAAADYSGMGVHVAARVARTGRRRRDPRHRRDARRSRGRPGLGGADHADPRSRRLDAGGDRHLGIGGRPPIRHVRRRRAASASPGAPSRFRPGR